MRNLRVTPITSKVIAGLRGSEHAKSLLINKNEPLVKWSRISSFQKEDTFLPRQEVRFINKSLSKYVGYGLKLDPKDTVPRGSLSKIAYKFFKRGMEKKSAIKAVNRDIIGTLQRNIEMEFEDISLAIQELPNTEQKCALESMYKEWKDFLSFSIRSFEDSTTKGLAVGRLTVAQVLNFAEQADAFIELANAELLSVLAKVKESRTFPFIADNDFIDMKKEKDIVADAIANLENGNPRILSSLSPLLQSLIKEKDTVEGRIVLKKGAGASFQKLMCNFLEEVQAKKLLDTPANSITPSVETVKSAFLTLVSEVPEVDIPVAQAVAFARVFSNIEKEILGELQTVTTKQNRGINPLLENDFDEFNASKLELQKKLSSLGKYHNLGVEVRWLSPPVFQLNADTESGFHAIKAFHKFMNDTLERVAWNASSNSLSEQNQEMEPKPTLKLINLAPFKGTRYERILKAAQDECLNIMKVTETTELAEQIKETFLNNFDSNKEKVKLQRRIEDLSSYSVQVSVQDDFLTDTDNVVPLEQASVQDGFLTTTDDALSLEQVSGQEHISMHTLRGAKTEDSGVFKSDTLIEITNTRIEVATAFLAVLNQEISEVKQEEGLLKAIGRDAKENSYLLAQKLHNTKIEQLLEWLTDTGRDAEKSLCEKAYNLMREEVEKKQLFPIKDQVKAEVLLDSWIKTFEREVRSPETKLSLQLVKMEIKANNALLDEVSSALSAVKLLKNKDTSASHNSSSIPVSNAGKKYAADLVRHINNVTKKDWKYGREVPELTKLEDKITQFMELKEDNKEAIKKVLEKEENQVKNCECSSSSCTDCASANTNAEVQKVLERQTDMLMIFAKNLKNHIQKRSNPGRAIGLLVKKIEEWEKNILDENLPNANAELKEIVKDGNELLKDYHYLLTLMRDNPVQMRSVSSLTPFLIEERKKVLSSTGKILLGTVGSLDTRPEALRSRQLRENCRNLFCSNTSRAGRIFKRVVGGVGVTTLVAATAVTGVGVTGIVAAGGIAAATGVPAVGSIITAASIAFLKSVAVPIAVVGAVGVTASLLSSGFRNRRVVERERRYFEDSSASQSQELQRERRASEDSSSSQSQELQRERRASKDSSASQSQHLQRERRYSEDSNSSQVQGGYNGEGAIINPSFIPDSTSYRQDLEEPEAPFIFKYSLYKDWTDVKRRATVEAKLSYDDWVDWKKENSRSTSEDSYSEEDWKKRVLQAKKEKNQSYQKWVLKKAKIDKREEREKEAVEKREALEREERILRSQEEASRGAPVESPTARHL